MAKQTPFFKFDSASWLGGSIQFLELKHKGLFIDLCAIYWESECEPIKIDKKLQLRTRVLEGDLSNLIGDLTDLEITCENELGITIPFLDELMEKREEFINKCSKGGKKSRSLKQPTSNKKEERRKKRVESRNKKEETIEEKRESKRADFIEKVNELFKKKKAEQYSSKFCDYWTAINEFTDTMRFEDDPYFLSSLTLKVTSWIDRERGIKEEDIITVEKAEGFE